DLFEIDPSNEEVYIQRAILYSKINEHHKAIEMLKQALQFTDDMAEIYSMIGMEYLFMDQLEDAKKFFILCLNEDYEDQTTLYNVIYCFDFLEQSEEAITYLNAYINKNPYSDVAWHHLGRQYYYLKDFKKALWAYDYATLINETFYGGYIEKAKTLEKLKRYPEAINCYNIALELDDVTSFLLLRLAKCHEKIGNTETALKYYTKTVHEDPLLDKGWIAITDFYIRQHNFKKALYYVNKAIGIQPDNKLYWKRFACINRTLGYFEEAKYGYQKAHDLGDTSLEIFTNWADMFQQLGDIEKSIEILLSSLKKHANRPEINYRLAGLYFTIQETKKGTFHLINALQHSFKNISILEKNFPNVWQKKSIQNLITKFKNSNRL
ncbi:MAG TPA: hypothetical protein DDZ41_04360, partial [Flavobacterium sp.]|nr:hypothetical protein [Flavobacterium sp.]